MDYAFEAKKILCECTNGYMQGVIAHYNSNREMMEDMYNDCAYILTDHFINGDYSPLQYNAIRNELSKMIWKIFEAHVVKEDETEFAKLYSI